MDARTKPEYEIIAGGNADDSTGYFVEPTVVVTTDPRARLACEEIFGPILTIFVYEDGDLDATLEICDTASPYALTGAIFAQDRGEIVRMSKALRHAAGNFYINDKPTGAVVGQQPFGGSRASGTNDKAGSPLNLLVGHRYGRSRRPSSRRPTTATRTWTRSRKREERHSAGTGEGSQRQRTLCSQICHKGSLHSRQCTPKHNFALPEVAPSSQIVGALRRTRVVTLILALVGPWSRRGERARGDRLERKANKIGRELKRRHLPHGTIFDPVFASPESNKIVDYQHAGDAAIWTGHYIAAESFHYAATGSRKARANVRRALVALKLLVEVTGNDVLARAAVPVGSRWEDTLLVNLTRSHIFTSTGRRHRVLLGGQYLARPVLRRVLRPGLRLGVDSRRWRYPRARRGDRGSAAGVSHQQRLDAPRCLTAP